MKFHSKLPKPFYDFAILGGGLSGLLIGNELKKRNRSFIVLEKESRPGGLVRTVKSAGSPGDLGPHALYSRNPKVMRFFRSLTLRYDVHHRKVRIVHRGTGGKIYEVGYPFENGLGDLPIAERQACVEGYIAALLRKPRSFKHLREWIHRGLGTGIERHFMGPYNEKIWNCQLEHISLDLVRKKIDPASAGEVLRSAFGEHTVGRKVQAVFLYPRGGVGAMTDVLAQRIADHLRCRMSVESIERWKGGYRIMAGGRIFFARKIISTIPLKEFLRVQPFRDLQSGSRRLHHNDTLFISVLLRKKRKFHRFDDCHWLFFAGDELFYRANMMHVFHRTSDRHLLAEVTWKKPVNRMSSAAIRQRVIADLLKDGILKSPQDVRAIVMRKTRYTYPIPTIGLPRLLKRLERVFESKGIYIIGRNGRWDYINMDQVVERVWSFFERLPLPTDTRRA